MNIMNIDDMINNAKIFGLIFLIEIIPIIMIGIRIGIKKYLSILLVINNIVNKLIDIPKIYAIWILLKLFGKIHTIPPRVNRIPLNGINGNTEKLLCPVPKFKM